MSSQWERAAELFERALGLGPRERVQLLDALEPELRRQVERLLEGDERAGSRFLEPKEGLPSTPRDDWTGRILGAYEVRREIGSGGMGRVFLAERRDGEYQQRVAIKLVRAGRFRDETRRRLRIERQILAELGHPNIARLLDGGTTEDGDPFFVLEHIEGEPIDTFCDRARLRVDDRIELFLDVCDAVAYSHENRVVHRDLKPANILVTDSGQAKLLDFGIAKLLGDTTETDRELEHSTRVWTPSFSSPEQFSGGAITAASDVYSLGVLLHLLLSGELPKEGGGRVSDGLSDEAATARRTTQHALARRLVGDLDEICRRALQPDPDERYPSVDALIDDLRRHQQQRPVEAHPSTIRYRATKLWLRQRKVLTVAAGAAVLISLLAGVAALLGARLESQKDQSDQVRGLFVEAIKGLDPAKDPTDGSTLEWLDRTSATLETASMTPAARSDLELEIGSLYLNLGHFEHAMPRLESALAIRRSEHDARSQQVAEAELLLGTLYLRMADYVRAEELLKSSIEGLQHSEAAHTPSFVQALGLLCDAKGKLAHHREAEALCQRAVEGARSIERSPRATTGAQLVNLGTLLVDRGKLQAGGDALRRGIEALAEVYPADHPELAAARSYLGSHYYYEVGDFERSAAVLRTACESFERRLGYEHPKSLGCLQKLLHAERMLSPDPAATEDRQRRLVETRRRVLGEGHPWTLLSRYTLAKVLQDSGRLGEAHREFRQVLSLAEKVVPPANPNFAHPLSGLGDVLVDLGRLEEAEPLLRRAHRLTSEHYPETYWRRAETAIFLGVCLAKAGPSEEAERLLSQAIPILLAYNPKSRLARKGQEALAGLRGSEPALGSTAIAAR